MELYHGSSVLVEIPEIRVPNVHLFIPHKVSKICAKFSEDKKISIAEAIKLFYASKTSALLADESSKLWRSGWTGIYDLFVAECEG